MNPRLWFIFTVSLAVAATTHAFQSVVWTPRPQNGAKPPLAAASASVPKSGGKNVRFALHLHLETSLLKSLSKHNRLSTITVLQSASGDDDTGSNNDNNSDYVDNDDTKDKTDKKIAGRKKRVLIGYRLSAAIYALLGVATLVPAVIRPVQMAPVALNYAGGPVLAAGVAYILAGAAEHDRLGSDTYKRLNLMLAKFGFLWLLAALLVKQTTPLTRGAKILSNPLVVLASLSALINGIKGWGYGAKGWDKGADKTFLNDLVELKKSTVNVFTSPIGNTKAGFYLAATVFGVFLNVSKVMEFLKMMSAIGSTSTATAAKFGTWAISFAKLNLLTLAALTLTDAAKRDRLQGTTFIELNVLSSFTWLGLGAYMFHSGDIVIASLSTIFSSFSLLSGASSYLKKKEAGKS